MRKISVVLFVIIVLFALSACGNSDDAKNDSPAPPPSDQSQEENNTPATEEEKPAATVTAKDVDSVAKAIGIDGEGEETLFQMIGAIAGKEYNDGEVEIYQFEEDSDAYKEIENSGAISGLKVSAYKDGFTLIFANSEDAELIAKFNELVF